MPTVNFELRNRPDKKGYCSIRVVIQDRGKRVYIPLPLKLLKSDWDSDNQKVKPTHPNAAAVNNALKLKRADLNSSVAIADLSGTMSLDAIAGRKVSKTSFAEFSGNLLHRWEKTKKPGTLRSNHSMHRQVIKFDRSLCVEDITPDWLARYEDHSRKTCGDNATWKRIAYVSIIVGEALRKGIIEKDPFLIYKKPAKKNPPRVWLELPEISKIEKLARENGSETLRKTAWWFLLSCYTGLRYADIETFDTKKMIREGRIILYTHKTGDIVSMKLTRKIRQLVKIVEKLGPVFSNQKCNQYLKSVAHHAGIDHPITFHTARHSFGVNCANMGISIEVTSKLMGHSDIRTTSIYYKIINKRVDEEMKKWER